MPNSGLKITLTPPPTDKRVIEDSKAAVSQRAHLANRSDVLETTRRRAILRVLPRNFAAPTPRSPASPIHQATATPRPPSIRQLAIELCIRELGLPDTYKDEHVFFAMLETLHELITTNTGATRDYSIEVCVPGYYQRTDDEKRAFIEQITDLKEQLDEAYNELKLTNRSWVHVVKNIDRDFLKKTKARSLDAFLREHFKDVPTTVEELGKLWEEK